MSKWQRWIGWGITIPYLVGLVWLAIARWDRFGDMPPNEWGDTLAGAFGPLAFLWLVLGYLQQGEELRLNTKALQLQGEELRLQTAELKAAVDQHKLQVEAAREALVAEQRPLLTVTASMAGDVAGLLESTRIFPVLFQIHNAGRTPAENMHFHVQLVVMFDLDALDRGWQQVSEAHEFVRGSDALGSSIAPRSTVDMPRHLTVIGPELMDRVRAYAAVNDGRWPDTLIIGFAYYESIMGSTHKTSFGYRISWRNPATGQVEPLPSIVLVPLGDIVVQSIPALGTS